MSENKANKTTVICLSTEGLTADIWTNKQHLMSRLSKREEYEVIYVDQGMSTREIKKAIKNKNWKYFLFPVQKYNENLKNYSLYYLPLIKGGFLKKISWRLLFRILNKKIESSNFEEIIIWVYQPQAYYFIEELKKKEVNYKYKVIYDCVDDFKTQPFYKNNKVREEELVKIENALVSNSDIVTTTSEQLFKDKSKLNSNTHYIHNVGDFEHFHQPKKELPSKFKSLKEIEKDIVTYAGVIDDYKIDLELIDYVTERVNSHFLFIGPVRVKNKIQLLDKLKQKENVQFSGYVDYEELPAVLHVSNILWLPYQSNKHTKYVFPLKLFEAFATGKKVVARNLESYQVYKGCMQTFDNTDQAISELKKPFSESLSQKRIELAKNNSWESRLNKILEKLEEV